MNKKYKILSKISMILTVMFISLSCSQEEIPTLKEGSLPLATDYQDNIEIEVNQETNWVTFTFSAKEVVPIWIIDDKTYSTDFQFEKYYRKAGEYSISVKISNANGISDGVITKTFVLEKTIMSGFSGFDYNSEFNIWRKSTVSIPSFWYAPGWEQIDDPAYTFSEGSYNLTFPESTFETWQAQMFLESDINTTSDNKYDFSAIFTSTKDHSNITVKLVDGADDNLFYFTDVVKLKANEPLCHWKAEMDGLDITNLKLVLDFGGNEDNTNITIENIVFKNSADDDGTVVPEIEDTPDINWVDVNSEDNFWHNINFTNTYYYAPGWEQLPNPEITIDGTEYSTSFPSATWEQWQNQLTFITDDLALSADTNYDFKVTLLSSTDIAAVTVKLAQNDDDGLFLFDERIKLTADSEVDLKLVNMDGVDISQAKIVFDFGGNPDNTDIVIKDIIIQKHID